jgi:hypothetical protein
VGLSLHQNHIKRAPQLISASGFIYYRHSTWQGIERAEDEGETGGEGGRERKKWRRRSTYRTASQLPSCAIAQLASLRPQLDSFAALRVARSIVARISLLESL